MTTKTRVVPIVAKCESKALELKRYTGELREAMQKIGVLFNGKGGILCGISE